MIDDFPSEILTLIFSYLPPWTLHTVATITTHWSNIAETLGARRLDFSHFDQDQFKEDQAKLLIDHITNTIPTDRDGGATIRHLLIISHHILPTPVFLFIQEQCPNVISFDYDRQDLFRKNKTKQQRHLFYSSNWRDSIAHLPLCQQDSEEPYDRWWDDSDFCLRLESLHVRPNDNYLTFYKFCFRANGLILPSLPQLTVLTLHIPLLVLNEYTLDKVHRQCPQLTHLTLCELTLSNHRSHVATIPIDIEPRITTLALKHVTFLDVNMYIMLAQKYPRLQSLTLATTHHRHHGRRLTTSHCTCGASERIYDMIVGFPYLTRLDIHLEGFGKQQHHAFQEKIQAYFSQPSNKHIDWKFTYGSKQHKNIESVRKMISKVFV